MIDKISARSAVTMPATAIPFEVLEDAGSPVSGTSGGGGGVDGGGGGGPEVSVTSPRYAHSVSFEP